MKKLAIYISLLFVLTCAKEDSQAPNTPPTQIVKQYTLTASAGEGGSVTGGGTFASGTQVSLTATPTSGYSFSGWSTGSTANPLTVTLNSNTTITANFQVILNSYTLTVTAGEGGSVSTEGGEYDEGTEVTLIATPQEGYRFTGWSDGSTEESITITLNSDTALTANFELIPIYTLTVTAGDGGTVSTEGGEYEEGTEVTITVTPDEGYEFTEWSDGSTEESVTITLNSDILLTASFGAIVSSYLSNMIGDVFESSLVDADITSSLDFRLVNDLNYKDYNHLIVDISDNHPVFSGNKSLRFQLNKGECSYNDSFNDCINDRSRTELYEYNRVNLEPNMIQSYEYSMYLVSNQYFNPGSDNNAYAPLTIVSQIYFDDKSIEGDAKGQFYLLVDNDQNLRIRTHTPFTYNIDKQELLMENIFDKWITIKMELDNKFNMFRLYIDGDLVFQDNYTFIPENNIDPQYFFKAGVYNSFMSEATKEYRTQVIYYDNLERFIE
jgi:hypothetical protein